MLLRRQEGTGREGCLFALAISLGLAADGYHARPHPAPTYVGETWRLAKARR
jgi:hypothetical protein